MDGPVGFDEQATTMICSEKTPLLLGQVGCAVSNSITHLTILCTMQCWQSYVIKSPP